MWLDLVQQLPQLTGLFFKCLADALLYNWRVPEAERHDSAMKRHQEALQAELTTWEGYLQVNIPANWQPPWMGCLLKKNAAFALFKILWCHQCFSIKLWVDSSIATAIPFGHWLWTGNCHNGSSILKNVVSKCAQTSCPELCLVL